MHLSDEQFARYVDHMRSDTIDQAPESIRLHLEDCAQCHVQVVDLYMIMEAEPQAAQTTTETPTPVIGMPWLRYAAAAVVLLGLVFAGLYVSQNSKKQILPGPLDQEIVKETPNVKPAIEPIDSLNQEIATEEEEKTPAPEQPQTNQETPQIVQETPKKPKVEPAPEIKEPAPATQSDEVLYAMNFTPNASLDRLTNMEMRDGSFAAKTPVNGNSYLKDQPITFSWETSITDPMEIVILNNRGKKLSSQSANSGMTYLAAHEPGRYYWKLETEEELLITGTFYIRTSRP